MLLFPLCTLQVDNDECVNRVLNKGSSGKTEEKKSRDRESSADKRSKDEVSRYCAIKTVASQAFLVKLFLFFCFSWYFTLISHHAHFLFLNHHNTFLEIKNLCPFLGVNTQQLVIWKWDIGEA